MEIFFHGNTSTPGIYRMHSISGVFKESESLLSERGHNYSAANVSQARQDVKVLAKKLLSWYKETGINTNKINE